MMYRLGNRVRSGTARLPTAATSHGPAGAAEARLVFRRMSSSRKALPLWLYAPAPQPSYSSFGSTLTGARLSSWTSAVHRAWRGCRRGTRAMSTTAGNSTSPSSHDHTLNAMESHSDEPSRRAPTFLKLHITGDVDDQLVAALSAVPGVWAVHPLSDATGVRIQTAAQHDLVTLQDELLRVTKACGYGRPRSFLPGGPLVTLFVCAFVALQVCSACGEEPRHHT